MATSSGETSVEIQEGILAAVAEEESPEEEETYDNDDYYCDKCKSSFKTQCEVHGPPVFALDSSTPMGTLQRALLTLPAGLVVGRSRVNEGSLGIFNQGQVVPVGIHFGPYDGEVTSEEEALKSGYSWVICKGRNRYEFIDATRDTHSNWMRFVMCSRSNREQNLVAFQQGGRLLFRCCSPIRLGQELLVWYSEEYARHLGLTWDQLWDNKLSSSGSNTDIGSPQLLACPYCRFSFPAKPYLHSHVRRSHPEQHHHFLETPSSESESEALDPPVVLDTFLLGSDGPPSAQIEPVTDTGKQGSESHQSNGMRCSTCRNGISDTDWPKDTSSSVSPTNEKGHICALCGRTFARAYHLKRHEEAVHSPDKLYLCRPSHKPQKNLRKNLRKPSNPRRHRPSPQTEVEEEEEEEEAETARGAPLEVYPCPQCSTAFVTEQSLQEHVELNHPQGERSDAFSTIVELSELDFCDPSDPPYEPPARKHNLRKASLMVPSQRRGRGRPRTRIALLTRPKRKRTPKAQREGVDPQSQAQTHICCQWRETLADGATATSHSCCAQNGTQLTCAECQRVFADRAALRSHECVLQEGEGLYSCPQCSLPFSQPSNLRRHQRTVHALVKPYCCGQCGKFYTQASGLKRHQEGRQHKRRRLASASVVVATATTAAATPIYSCAYCQFSFTAQRYLHKHVKRHHPTKFIQALDGEPQREEEQDEEEEEGGGGAREGLARVATQARVPQSCPQCEKTFISIKGFKSHRCFRRGEKTYPCLVCDKGFTSFYSLRQHQRIHTGEKPHVCPHCSKSFAVVGQLNVHLRTHTGERPYLCSQCGEGFRQSGDLKRHEQKHLGVRPHPCPQCPKSFSRPQSLRAHLQIHSGERLYRCAQCNKSFTRGYHLTRHHHKMHSLQEQQDGSKKKSGHEP